ncbi:MAG: response regulator [Alphaproteobacteria bacterium]|nr:response regulator [Alphaproteobacteria bacterium]
MARILLIEDEPDTSYALTAVLNGAGYDVDTADGAESALERLADQPYDLMVCDLQLAHNQASAVLAAARTAELDAVAISGGGLAAAADQLRQAKALGAAGVLYKPFETATLLATVERVLDGVAGSAWQGENRRSAPRGPTPSV